jgi:hypothetical protein
MKNQIKYAVFVLSLIMFSASSFKTQDVSLPTLRGGAAVEKLKQAGQYDSLVEAFNAEIETTNAVSQTAKLVGSDGSNGDAFGIGVAISGNTAVAGAWGHDIGEDSARGAVYVFVRNGTTWTEQQKLTASDGAENDGFGFSVTIEGDTIIVGSWHDQIGNNVNQGSVYVFTRSGTTWTEQQKLTAADGGVADEFGRSVAIDGSTLIVGATQADGNQNSSGAAYVFTRSGMTWTFQQKLTASDGSAFDEFGYAALDGDTAVVGAPHDDTGGTTDHGAAYVFVRSGGVWTQQQKLIAEDGNINDFFGGLGSVAISGETIAIGAPLDNVGTNSSQGSVYVFTRSGTVWTLQTHLLASDGAPSSQFGRVSLEGDTLLVGAPGVNVGLNAAVGSAYIFTRSGAVWTERQQIIASDGASQDSFGTKVALAGNKILVGAPDANIGMQNDQGVAYIFISKVSVSGRVLTAGGIGIPNASVQATLANGSTVTARTTSFGYYTLENIEADQTITISVSSKRFQFTPVMVEVTGNLTNVDITAQP